MPTLTPADVHNVGFSRPPIGKRGYNEEEVDQFLDLIEVELSRLIEENSDLQQRVSELTTELDEAQNSVAAAQQEVDAARSDA
ncbi:DivIVA domain-containing protein, partial [Lawsonella clevelandensis]